MNRKEALFTNEEKELMTYYNLSEDDIFDLRDAINIKKTERMKRDFDRMATGIGEQTAEKILIKEKKWTTERIMTVDNWREKEKAKKYEEDEKKMMLESQPLKNAAKVFAKGFGLVVVTALTNIATNELSKTGSKLVKEGAGQGFKLGVNTLKEKKRG
jgi:hypothetical protein